MRPSGTAMPARASSCFAWYSWSVTDVRMWHRTTDRIRRRERLWGGNQETIRNTFFSRDSLFVWALTTHRRRRRNFELLMTRPDYAQVRFHRLRSADDAVRWLATERARAAERI